MDKPSRLRCRHCNCPRVISEDVMRAFGYITFKCNNCNRITAKSFEQVRRRSNRKRDLNFWLDLEPGKCLHA